MNVWPPNITGSVWNVSYQDSNIASKGFSVNGCFERRMASEGVGFDTDGQPATSDGFNFDSSLSNSIYNGNAVQIPSVQVLACIRI